MGNNRSLIIAFGIIPLASAGVQFVVGLLALGFWGMILFTGSGQPTTFSLIVYFGASLLLLKMTVEQILKHRQFPVLHGSNSQPSLKFTANPHIAKRAILWIENRGFIAGLFAPLILVAVVLGTATLIGYINFTYFE